MEILRNYSNLRGAEILVLALIDDARTWRTPKGNRNEKALQNRVRRLSENEIARLVTAYRAGDSVYVLGRRFGIHRTTVSEHLARAGVETRAKKRVELTVDDRGRAIDAASSGMSVQRIAAMMCTTDRVIARTLDNAGIPRRRRQAAAS